jgi:glycosyltransferase involved in cell wall biosynthesis
MDDQRRTRRPLRIAMIGQKGLPATFGGIERHVEEVGARLAARGHEVTVYCRPSYATERRVAYRGMRLRYAVTAGTKHLDAIVHSATSTAVALTARPDIVHYHALGPGLVAPLPRYLSHAKVVLTVHGLDNERSKWGRAARAVLGTAHWMSARVPDATVVVSRALAEHYASTFARATSYIPNGVEEPSPRPEPGADGTLTRLGLTPGRYALFVGRLVPEKAPDQLLTAFRSVPGEIPLVIAGDSSFTDGYVARLRAQAAADPRVMLPGYVYGDALAELYAGAGVFVLPSLLEGLPLTLLAAASYGVPVVASDIAPHREVIGAGSPGARLYPAGDVGALTAALTRVIGRGTAEEERRGALDLRGRVLATYSWENAVAALEELYHRLAAGTDPGVPAPSPPTRELSGAGREARG